MFINNYTISFPKEILLHIFSFLEVKELIVVSRVCKLWKRNSEEYCVGWKRAFEAVPLLRKVTLKKYTKQDYIKFYKELKDLETKEISRNSLFDGNMYNAQFFLDQMEFCFFIERKENPTIFLISRSRELSFSKVDCIQEVEERKSWLLENGYTEYIPSFPLKLEEDSKPNTENLSFSKKMKNSVFSIFKRK